ncbi:ATP-binding cassette domain-containing protein [Siculibacillus lacustris]|uniref:ATP-binding cassette domain-containing protein n=1 Tax=Siculibacillus lacustris TaxID=1549641 RepID=A0A4Q9VNI8_9HYPH|nr:ATP-binding cassette domain-containing protein [Siculibacillus lacustris]TBW36994.1 ATP-binding cassette domain-containing protein [Siculibacillus lacustris]
MTAPILRLDDLCKHYGALPVTDHVSLEVGRHEIHAVIGPNGAGKSTLVGEIAGSIVPDHGRVLIDGEDVTGESVAARARRGLARVFQTSRVIKDFSTLDNALLAAIATDGTAFRFLTPVAGETATRERARAALDRVGLADRGDVLAGRLAHGEKRALELAMGLVQAPRLLLLDEPMAGTGREETERLTELLASLAGEVAMLIVEHDMATVFRLADRITVLIGGAVAICGTPAEIRADPTVRSAYLGEGAP